MPGKKKKSAKDKREDNVRRQHSVRNKRKESGLKGVTIYLDAPTKKILGELCIESGYNPIENRGIGADALSNTIGALIRKASGINHEFACSNIKVHQELYRLRNIVRHRQLKANENNEEIAKFMETYGYPRPCVVTGMVGANEADSWREADIETLIDKRKLKKLIEEAEEVFD